MVNADFVCCCIPLINVGIYFVLLEHLVAGIAAGVLTVASPTIVGSSVPTFTLWIFAIFCFVVALIQVLGLIGVVQEKKGLFKVYTIANMVAVFATFSVAAALVLVSGLKRETAIAQCQADFYAPSTTNTTTTITPLANSAEKICEIFTIVDVSVMGGLWVVLMIVQSYFLAVISMYRKEQTEDHSRYNTMYSTKGGFPQMDAEDIPLASTDPNGDVFRDTRTSTDSYRGGYQPPASHIAAGGAYHNPSASTDSTTGYAPQYLAEDQHHQNPYGMNDSYDGPRDPYGHQQQRDGGFVPPAEEGYGREEVRPGAWEQEHQMGTGAGPTWEQENAYGGERR